MNSKLYWVIVFVILSIGAAIQLACQISGCFVPDPLNPYEYSWVDVPGGHIKK